MEHETSAESTVCRCCLSSVVLSPPVLTAVALSFQSVSPGMPRVKYMREFPSPPPGTIRIFNESASMRNSEAADAFPFGALPSIVKAKR